MNWTINVALTAQKQLKKIHKADQLRILNFLENKLLQQNNPREQGKALKGKHRTLWRYRVGDYRLICAINEGCLEVLVLALGHRKNIYQNLK